MMNNKLLVILGLIFTPVLANADTLAPCAQEAYEKGEAEINTLLRSGRLPSTTVRSTGTEEGNPNPVIIDYNTKKSDGDNARYSVTYKLTNSAPNGRKQPAEIGTATYHISIDIKKTSDVGYRISCVVSKAELELDLTRHYR